MVFDSTFIISEFWLISLVMTSLWRHYRKMLKFPEVALDGFGFLTSNTFRINHKKAYLFNFRVRKIFTRLFPDPLAALLLIYISSIYVSDTDSGPNIPNLALNQPVWNFDIPILITFQDETFKTG